MHLKRFAFAALLCLTTVGAASAQNVFVVPTGGASSAVSVVAGDTFTFSSTIQASPSTFAVLGQTDGSQYYFVSRDALLVVDRNGMTARLRRQLNQASAAGLSPDGRKLLIATADGLLIFDTTTFSQATPPDPITIATATVGGTPTGIAFSLDGSRAFVVSTISQRLTAIDLASNQAVTPSASITGGIDPASVSVAPNGNVYVSTVNAIYEFDARTLTLKSTTSFRGNAGKLYFTPDGTYGFAVNQFVINGGSSLLLFDPVAHTVTGVPVASGATLNGVAYAGKSAQGKHVVFAWSRGTGKLYEVVLPELTVVDSLLASGIDNILGFSTSDELTPRYLLVASPSGLYRLDITGQTPQSVVALNNGAGDVYYIAPVSNANAGSIVLYNNSQTVRANAAYAPLIVRVLDAAGRPVANAPITWSSANNAITFTNASTTTTAQGYAIAYPSTPGVNGSYTVAVTSGAATANFILGVTGGTTPGGGTPGGGNTGGLAGLFPISGQGQVSYVNQPTIEPLVVQLRNDQGKPIAGVPVTFTLQDQAVAPGFLTPAAITGDIYTVTCSSLTTCVGVTDANGKTGLAYFAGFVLPGSGYSQAFITASTSLASTTFVVSVLSQDNAVGVSSIAPQQGTVLTVPAGGTLKDAIKVTLSTRGPNGFGPIANVGVKVTTPNTDPATGVTASCASGSALSNSSGVATCDLVAGPVLGNSPLSLIVANREFFYSIRVVPGTASKINITSGAELSGQPGANLGQIVATVVDQAGNPLSGVPVTWQISNAQGATLTGASTTSGEGGRVSAGVTAGTVPGTHTVTIRAGNLSATTTVRVLVPLGRLAATSGGGQTAATGQQFGQALIVTLTDAQGNPVPNTSVAFTTTGGTLSAPSATTNAQGQASVTLTAGNTAGPVTVTASAGGLNATFNLTVRPPGPQFTIGNLLNGAGFNSQRFVAPGQILTITGTGLALGVHGVLTPVSMVGPLPTTLNNTTVTIGGIQAPIYNIANMGGREQITVQVPFELQAGTATSITVNVQGGSTTIDNVPVQPVAPGVFETDFGTGVRYGVVLKSDGSYVSPTNPARRGDILKMFSAGLGQVTPGSSTNFAGTGGQRPVGNVVVGINNAGVRVLGTEYVEGLVGVYLTTFEVPQDAPSGNTVALAIGIQPPGATENTNSNGTNIAIQ